MKAKLEKGSTYCDFLKFKHKVNYISQIGVKINRVGRNRRVVLKYQVLIYIINAIINTILHKALRQKNSYV